MKSNKVKVPYQSMSNFWNKKYQAFKGREIEVVDKQGVDPKSFVKRTEIIENIYCDFIHRGKIVLDYGCGIGRFKPVLLKYFNEYIGVDLVKKIPKGTNFILAKDFLKTDLKVDAVHTSVVLQHIVDDEYVRVLFKKFCEIIQPGGYLYMHEQVGDDSITYRDGFPYIVKRKRETYLDMVQPLGFKLLREIPRSSHRMFKFIKG